jgi:hypothetical protein
MKKIWLSWLCLLWAGGLYAAPVGTTAAPVFDSLVQAALNGLSVECHTIRQSYGLLQEPLLEALQTVKEKLRQRPDAATCLELLYAKDSLLEKLGQLQQAELGDISRMRYRKGLQIIKILYEKVLGLDHHFAAVRTFNEISNLSNPNHYPDFKRLKENLQQSERRKGFELTSLLDKNIYTNIFGSLIKLFNTSRERTEKSADLKNIECIVDFTLQMHQDLKTIFYETAFLQQSNEGIKTGIEQLFKEYTKPIRYESTLDNCRANDDWDRVEDLLDVYMRKLNEVSATKEMAAKTNKLQVNLEFQIDRLLQFIGQYNNFIDQGEKYYGKFSLVLTSYSNKQDCAAIIPQEYMKLSDDINIAINKFKTAYKPVEVNGSKLKELLYGVNDAE